MSQSVELSTEKKEKARQVFGSAVTEDEVDNSLSYSPSPQKTGTGTVAKLASIIPETCQEETWQDKEQDTSMDSCSASSRLSNPFEKVVGCESAPDKENAKNNDAQATANAKNKGIESSYTINETVTRMRMQERSPLRRDLVKKTQEAITRASVSVNLSLNASRKAMQSSSRQKTAEAAKARREWQQDKADSKAFYDEMEKNRKEILSLHRQLSTKVGKEKGKKALEERQLHIETVDKESLFNSSVYRDQQEKLRQEADKRRRASIEARNKLWANRRAGEQKLRLQRIKEDEVILEERYEASKAFNSSLQEQSKKRRDSFAFRNGDARRIRELHAKMEASRLEEESKSYALKQEADRDADAYKQKLAEERRNSLAFRSKEALKQRNEQEKRKKLALEEEMASYQLKEQAERDAEAYRKKLAEERRNSLAFRGKEASRQRKEEADREKAKLEAESASYRLKEQGERDADAYKKKMADDRRNSLIGRNREGKRQQSYVDQRRQEELDADHQSYELKFAGERDAEFYKKKMDMERRESLARRNLEAKQQRDRAAQQKREVLEAEQEGYALKRAAEKDADEYKRKLDKERRDSLKSRNRESAQQAKVMRELRDIAREKETESLVLKWAGEDDAKAYLAKLEKERRTSLQLRGEQAVLHRKINQELHDRAIQEAHDDEKLRAEDHRDVEKYQKECAEKEKISLQYKGKEILAQRLQEKERHYQQQLLDGMNFQLESDAWADVQGYLKECRDRRRKSLVFRAREKRSHDQWKKRRADQEHAERSRDVRDHLMDKRYVEMAKQEERARVAMEAIKHSGCSFNPFSNVF